MSLCSDFVRSFVLSSLSLFLYFVIEFILSAFISFRYVFI